MTDALLVASTGGHLDELRLMVGVLGLSDCRRIWVTAKSPQSESLLRHERVVWVPAVGSRQFVSAAVALPLALRINRRLQPDLVVSTGAALAAPHLVAASMLRTPASYVESVTRRSGPSLTGRLAASLPGVTTMSQGWSDEHWQRVPDVFSGFERHPVALSPAVARPRVLVTLGQEQFSFHRAVVGVRSAVPDAIFMWQLGSTPVDGIKDGRSWVPAQELRREAESADVIVCHGGVGSVLMALQAGHVPVVLARDPARGEHVDGHQRRFTEELAARGLVVVADPDGLDRTHLEQAMGWTVTNHSRAVSTLPTS